MAIKLNHTIVHAREDFRLERGEGLRFERG
jgi:hypothetical protein